MPTSGALMNSPMLMPATAVLPGHHTDPSSYSSHSPLFTSSSEHQTAV
ncbi:unnamed protein product [Protopolystoma xenopodis]|uniref:Uncharacterized protein n=1 Tax=Protopolystoma xenopodis TaxID=117903 RepID=A0A3S5AIP7_9PLAT|nr:unnamed protein product [Protopolystoma xenopodis]